MFKASLPDPVVSVIPTPTNEPFVLPTRTVISAEKLETLVNNWRVSQNLQPLIHSDNMCKIALIRLSETKKNWSHQGFDASRFCSKACTLGENLAKGYSTEQQILNAWLKSPDHLTELKTPYTHACIKLDQTNAVETFGYF